MSTLTEKQLRNVATTVAHSFYKRNTVTTSDDIFWYDAQLFAERQTFHAVTEGEYTFTPISVDPKYHHDSFPGVGMVELSYQVNVLFYRSNEWGNDCLFAEVAVGYSSDGYPYTEVAYY